MGFEGPSNAQEEMIPSSENAPSCSDPSFFGGGKQNFWMPSFHREGYRPESYSLISQAPGRKLFISESEFVLQTGDGDIGMLH